MSCTSPVETIAPSRRSLRRVVRAELGRAIPTSVGALQFLGLLTLFLFAVQVVTGLLLMVYYRPSVEAAHHSMGVIIDEVRLGWLIRSLHEWGSDLLILTALLHLIRVYFARAYQPSQGASWVTGIALLLVMLGFAFTGTLLPWDQYAYWATDSSRETIARIPLIGSALLGLFWGGWDIGEEVLLRFYAFHVGILPWVALVWVGFHLLTVWYVGLKRPVLLDEADHARGGRVLDDLLLAWVMVGLLVIGVFFTLAILVPQPLLPQADPLSPLLNVQPPWYLLPARSVLRHVPRLAAVLIVLAMLTVVLSVPFLDRRERESLLGKGLRWLLGVSAIAAWIILAIQQYRS